MLMMTLVLGGLVLSGCGKKDPSTSSAHPTTTGGGETSSSGSRNLANALKADYSNMTVEVSLAYNNDDMGIMEEYFQEVIYDGYTIIPPLSDGDPALYYHDYNGESYLVIYFLKYYNYLKDIINKAKDVKIKPYEFTKKFKMKNKGINIIVREFKDEIYLVASVKQTIIYTKHFKQGEEVNYYVDKCLEQLKETFNIESFKLFIQENLYNNKLYELTKNIELIKGKVR